MANIELAAEQREVFGSDTNKLRREGKIPAVVYGHKFKTTPVIVDLVEFKKKVLKSKAGLNLIFNLELKAKDKKESVAVKTQDVQRDVLNGNILHLDFMNIIMDEKLTTSVAVELVGLPIGVKESGGVLVHGMRELEIECFPSDIPDKFVIDVSGLAIGESLHVADIKIDKKIKVFAEPSEMIANVSAPTKEEEPTPEALTPEQVLAEGAPPTEGAAPAEGEAVKAKAPVPAAGKEKTPPAK
ncbi:MAG: 50S ribosomal protein L25 [bacterium]